ncbi:MAG TPA: SLC13 family permease [Polyangiaceae bacterium]|jgi:arsenical pump membrane protein
MAGRAPFVGVVVAISIVLMLVRPRAVAEVYWVFLGVVVLVVSRAISPTLAAHALAEGRDVYLFLIGMMLLAGLARVHGVFEWLAGWAVRAARGSASRLFALVYSAGALVTIFMSNDATAVVLTPAILAATKRARVEPLPHLFACALIANAASFVLPISNPANLVVYGGRTPALGAWLLAFLLPSVASIAVTFVVLRASFRGALSGTVEEDHAYAPLGPSGRLVLGGLACTTVVLLVASAIHADLGLPTFAAAAVVAVAVSVMERRRPWDLAREVSWPTLGLVGGLFVLVEATRTIGLLDVTRGWLLRLDAWPGGLSSTVAGAAVAVVSNVANNLPVGLVVGETLRSSRSTELLSRALLVGVDLGPNLSVTGSLATLLWLIALRRERVNVTFGAFLKVGVRAMPLALAGALLSLLAVACLRARP